ncbi:MAG: hypothetical protein AAFV53_41540, partial [Myxococcota bacterium]
FIHLITNGDDLLIRLVDLFMLAGIASATAYSMRSHGWIAGSIAGSLFVLMILGLGPSNTLQRETICILLLAMTAGLSMGFVKQTKMPLVIIGLCGLLAGIATTIKPPIALLWLPLTYVIARRQIPVDGATQVELGKSIFSAALPFMVGGFSAGIVTLIWLSWNGALSLYFEIAREYYPLYVELNGLAQVVEPTASNQIDRLLIMPFRNLQSALLLVPAFLGFYTAVRSKDTRLVQDAWVMVGITFFGLVYLTVSGKFWEYHTIPLLYGLSIGSGLLFSDRLTDTVEDRSTSWIALFAIIISLPVTMLKTSILMTITNDNFEVKFGYVDVISDYLEKQVPRHATVMPLDVTGGAIHAMYRDNRPLHGKFIYDFHLYHHVDTPFVKKLRSEMISQMGPDGPDIIIQMAPLWRPSGIGTSDFPELNRILDTHYQVIKQDKGFRILRRRDSEPPLIEP